MVVFIVGVIIVGFMAAVPFAFFAFTRISKAKNQAKEILAKGKIDDMKQAEVILKLLNVTKDNESTHLWREMNALYEKQRRAS